MSLSARADGFYQAGGQLARFILGKSGQAATLAEIRGQIEALAKAGKLIGAGPNMAGWAFERFERGHLVVNEAMLIVAMNQAGEVAGLLEAEDLGKDPIWLMALGSFGNMTGVGSALVLGLLEEAELRGSGVRVTAAKSQGFYEKAGCGLQASQGRFYYGWDLAKVEQLTRGDRDNPGRVIS
jgi:hypothetical protein